MKKYFLITICLLVFGLSYGQKLIGNIVDQESNPIFVQQFHIQILW